MPVKMTSRESLRMFDLADIWATRRGEHVRLVSAGENGVIDTPFRPPFQSPFDPLFPARFPAREHCGDDLVLYVSVADLRP